MEKRWQPVPLLWVRYYQPEAGRFLTRDTYTGEEDEPLSYGFFIPTIVTTFYCIIPCSILNRKVHIWIIFIKSDSVQYKYGASGCLLLWYRMDNQLFTGGRWTLTNKSIKVTSIFHKTIQRIIIIINFKSPYFLFIIPIFEVKIGKASNWGRDC